MIWYTFCWKFRFFTSKKFQQKKNSKPEIFHIFNTVYKSRHIMSHIRKEKENKVMDQPLGKINTFINLEITYQCGFLFL